MNKSKFIHIVSGLVLLIRSTSQIFILCLKAYKDTYLVMSSAKLHFCLITERAFKAGFH